MVDLVKTTSAVSNASWFELLELEHVKEEPADLDILWPEEVCKVKVLPDIPREVHDPDDIVGTLFSEDLCEVVPHILVVLHSSFVFRCTFTIQLRDVQVTLIAYRHHDLVGFQRSNSPCIIPDLPPFAALTISSPVLWLDTVEHDSSISGELNLCSHLVVANSIELPVYVQRLSIVVFEVSRIGTLGPTSWKDAVHIDGRATPELSFWW